MNGFNNMKVRAFWPTVNVIENVAEKEPDKWVPYFCHVLEKAEPPKTKAEMSSKKSIIRFINKYSQLTEIMGID